MGQKCGVTLWLRKTAYKHMKFDRKPDAYQTQNIGSFLSILFSHIFVTTALSKNLALKHKVNFLTFIFTFGMCAMCVVNYMADLDLRSGRLPKTKPHEGAASQLNRLDRSVMVLLPMSRPWIYRKLCLANNNWNVRFCLYTAYHITESQVI